MPGGVSFLQKLLMSGSDEVGAVALGSAVGSVRSGHIPSIEH